LATPVESTKQKANRKKIPVNHLHITGPNKVEKMGVAARDCRKNSISRKARRICEAFVGTKSRDIRIGKLPWRNYDAAKIASTPRVW